MGPRFAAGGGMTRGGALPRGEMFSRAAKSSPVRQKVFPCARNRSRARRNQSWGAIGSHLSGGEGGSGARIGAICPTQDQDFMGGEGRFGARRGRSCRPGGSVLSWDDRQLSRASRGLGAWGRAIVPAEGADLITCGREEVCRARENISAHGKGLSRMGTVLCGEETVCCAGQDRIPGATSLDPARDKSRDGARRHRGTRERDRDEAWVKGRSAGRTIRIVRAPGAKMPADRSGSCRRRVRGSRATKGVPIGDKSGIVGPQVRGVRETSPGCAVTGRRRRPGPRAAPPSRRQAVRLVASSCDERGHVDRWI